MYDNKEQIPYFMIISDGERHDINAVRKMSIIADSIYVIDKGYFCYKFFEKINKTKYFLLFVQKQTLNSG